MNRRLTGIDHLVLGVQDLEAARHAWGRLGFNSTPRGRHVGWATANYCIMLERDYLELLGIVDPDRPRPGLLDRLAEGGEGPLALAVGTDDAEATSAAWRAAGLDAAPPQRLGRLLEAEAGVELRFENVLLPAGTVPGLGVFACRHLTPESLRRPAWLAHPNGATGIQACTIVAAEPAPIVAAMARVFGTSALADTDAVTAVQTGSAVVLIAPPEDAALIHPGLDPGDGAVPRLLVLTVTVRDPARAAAFLDLQGVPYLRRRDGGLLVAPEHAGGVALELVRG